MHTVANLLSHFAFSTQGRNNYKYNLGGTELSLTWSKNKLQLALSFLANSMHPLVFDWQDLMPSPSDHPYTALGRQQSVAWMFATFCHNTHAYSELSRNMLEELKALSARHRLWSDLQSTAKSLETAEKYSRCLS